MADAAADSQCAVLAFLGRRETYPERPAVLRIDTHSAIVFLAGANLGAAGYEVGLARATGALLRRVPAVRAEVIRVADLELDLPRMKARREGQHERESGGDAGA